MEKVHTFFKTLPPRLKDYFKKYFKELNYSLWILAILVMVGLFLADYFSKVNAFYYLTNGDWVNPIVNPDHDGTTIIPYILNFRFTINNGAGFGMFSGSMWFLTILSSIASVMLTINVLFRFNRYNWVMMTGIILMAPGAAGNLVYRVGCLANAGIYKHGVIDFLQFSFWPGFPICNLADYWLTIGVVFLLIGFTIEFVKEYKAMKLEEENEKAAALAVENSKEFSNEDLLAKLKEEENSADKEKAQDETSSPNDGDEDNDQDSQ